MKLQFDSIRPGEGRALGWSFAYFFCLLAGYYVLRPLRGEMGVAGGVRNLQWLFTATFLVMLAAVPLYGALVVWLAVPLGPANLLVIAALLLEAAVLCVKRLESVPRDSAKQSNRETDSATLSGGWFDGIAMLLRSPYLAAAPVAL